MDEEERNFCCLLLMLSRGLPKLRNSFIIEWDSAGGFAPWTDCPTNGADLLTKFKPLHYEVGKVKSGKSTTWDLSLLVKAMINSTPPLVPKSNKSLFDALTCLKDTRNNLCHAANGKMTSADFQPIYNMTRNALSVLGVSLSDIDKVKEDVKQKPWRDVLADVKLSISQDEEILQGMKDLTKRLDHLEQAQGAIQNLQSIVSLLTSKPGVASRLDQLEQAQGAFQEALQKLQNLDGSLTSKSEVTSRLDQLEQAQGALQEALQALQDLDRPSTSKPAVTSRLDQLEQALQDILQKLKNPDSSSTPKPADIEIYVVNLKEAIKQRTDSLPKGIEQSRQLKTDDIFTNLTVYQGKRNSQQTEEAQEDQRGRTDARVVKQCSEIFLAENGEECKPKSILVSGEPGIGKTLFSYKLLRDWSKSILIPEVHFAYLLTFRQLVLVAKKELTLRELLNLSPLLNEKSMIEGEAMMESIIQNQEQLFIVLDGFDEFKDHSILFGDFESQFANDLTKEMPVAALLSKIIQKKILRDSTILATSRTRQANELEKKVHFDKFVQIKGFTECQVLEYVEKYFSSKPEEVKKMAVDKVKGVAHYISFGQVPLRCLWICQTIELELEKNVTKHSSVPLTLTQFYSSIIRTLEKNNREMRNLDEEAAMSAVEKTLDNLAEVAAVLDEQNRFTFTTEDLKKLKIPQNEIVFLKSSSLIVCYPVTSNSLFQNTTSEYGFTHLTIQEFLVAWRYFKMAARETNCFKRFMAKKPLSCLKNPSEMVYTFVSGLLGQDENNHDDLMKEILNRVSEQVEDEWRRRVVLVRCLYEFGQEKELTRKQLTTNPDYKYWNKDGRIVLRYVANTDCGWMSMLVDKSSQPHALYIRNSPLSCSFFISFLPVLAKPHCNIIRLGLWNCGLDDQCVKCLIKQVPNTKITRLNLSNNNITDDGVQYIMDNFPTQLTRLWLVGNQVPKECTMRAKQFFKENYPGLNFNI